MIVISWVASILLGSVELFMARTTKYDFCGQLVTICSEHWQSDGMRLMYDMVNVVLVYVVPLIVLTFTYTVVGMRLWGRSMPGNADFTRDMTQERAKRKVIKMLVTIVLTFALCWLPLHIYQLLGNVARKMLLANPSSTFPLFFTIHWLAMANSFINPIIYGFLNDGFRADIRRVFRRCGPWKESIKPKGRYQGRLSLQSSLNTTRTTT
ncbi:substance-K receptor-like [Lytechinus variegatus]|uniref:substance-K receptor-like n=1 Tax=Lytechinus variegatus TaxID=7654 RepID=UPI001BB26AFF|nr:substance-K receptor-like [Lytechinus variegatus]